MERDHEGVTCPCGGVDPDRWCTDGRCVNAVNGDIKAPAPCLYTIDLSYRINWGEPIEVTLVGLSFEQAWNRYVAANPVPDYVSAQVRAGYPHGSMRRIGLATASVVLEAEQSAGVFRRGCGECG